LAAISIVNEGQAFQYGIVIASFIQCRHLLFGAIIDTKAPMKHSTTMMHNIWLSIVDRTHFAPVKFSLSQLWHI
jgi:hypothetical protein